MLRYRTQGLLAVGLGILAAGCLSEPDLKTNLRPEGDPEVLAVLAIDPVVTGSESASYCKYVGATLDEKGPGLVQGSTICPTEASEFEAAELFPLGWDIRIVFDELLNGDAVEELDCDVDGDGVQDNPIETCDGHIANTHPVTLTCGTTTIDYDGYYYPNGNKESFPVGPAIYVSPDPASVTVPTGTACTISINDIVVDKDGNTVGTGAQVGTFDLKIQDLGFYGSDPEEGGDPIAVDGAFGFAFNANLDAASVDATEVEVLDSTGAVVATVDFAVDSFNDASDGIFLFSTDAAGFAPGTYTARLKSGATFTEVNGGTVTLTENIDIPFTVEA
jgi:hypothetical protein